jgi:filamentous hemagglutinin family protein
MTAAAALLVLQRPALAGPSGGSVVAGSASISQSGSTTNVNQSSQSTIINWQSFSIAPKETVNFFQPNSSAVALNRVIGNETSIISGALNANGRVFIVNSAGVLFSKSAQVNVGGLVASTLDISNSDFMAGNYKFSGTSSASMVNRGNIHAGPGGYVALLGHTVVNDGVISARLGTVAMASGEQMTLNFGGNSLVDVTIDKGTLNALVANHRAIKADGGQVIMTAKAADQVLSAQVNNTGIVQARTIASLKGGAPGSTVHIGKIKILADGGTANIAGRLDASAPKGGNGGSIETSGSRVKVADSAIITTKAENGQNGNWLIDPDGFTIAAIGGDITGSVLGHELASSNVTIASTSGHGIDGNINVNDTVAWAVGTTLTLNATKAVNVNAVIAAPNGGLALNAGTDININAPSSLAVSTLNATAAHDVNINAAQTWTNAGAWTFNGTNINVNDKVNWSAGTLTLNAGAAGGFINLNAPMTASGTSSLVATYNTGMDTTTVLVQNKVTPSPTYGTPFGGINPLFDPAAGTFAGRIDFINNTAAHPLNINGNDYRLITSIDQLASLSTVSRNPDGSIALDPSTGNPLSFTVASGFYALANNLDASSKTYPGSVIYQLTGTLDGLGHTINHLTIAPPAEPDTVHGGLMIDGNLGLIGTVGTAGSGPGSGVVRDIGVVNIQIDDTVGNQGGSSVGALAALNWGTVINSFAAGSGSSPNPNGAAIAGNQSIGGLVGENDAVIVNSHADVSVYGITMVGGLVGSNTARNPHRPVIVDSYATGAVSSGQPGSDAHGLTGSSFIGGFVGRNNGGVISSSYATGSVTALNSSDVGGFIGQNANANASLIGTLSNVSSSGPVNLNWQVTIASGQDIGGLAGSNFGQINNSFTSSNVSVTTAGPTSLVSNVGAFAGLQQQVTALRRFGANDGSTATGNVTYNNNGTPATLSNFIGSDSGTTTNHTFSPGAGGTPPTQSAAQAAALSRVNQATNARSLAQGLTQQSTNQQVVVGRAQVGAGAANVSETTSSAITKATGANPGASSAGTGATNATGGSIDDNIQYQGTPTTSDERKHRRTEANRQNNHGNNFGATLRTIEINGRPFRLRGGPGSGTTPPSNGNPTTPP